MRSFPGRSVCAALALAAAVWPALAGTLRAQEYSESYSEALQSYKTGNDEQALTAIQAAEQATPNDAPTEILKLRILTELKDFDDAHKTLQTLEARTDLKPVYKDGLVLAAGDLGLRERKFDDATKSYESLLAAKPNDSDLVLRTVYARVGANDLVEAAKYASRLRPLDPVNPSYYFAKAALAEATGQSADADQNIETVRTIYGLTVANRYLRLYYELFSSQPKNGMVPDSGAMKTASP
jgi:predicted Zn-dependent protease